MMLEVVGVVGTCPASISSLVRSAQERRFSRIFQSVALMVHS